LPTPLDPRHDAATSQPNPPPADGDGDGDIDDDSGLVAGSSTDSQARARQELLARLPATRHGRLFSLVAYAAALTMETMFAFQVEIDTAHPLVAALSCRSLLPLSPVLPPCLSPLPALRAI
jgi:hypothetical protein